MEPSTFYLLSLGCPKNQVDSEVIAASLIGAGYRPVTDPLAAQVILVNTCAFIEAATLESVEAILELAGAKRQGQCSILAVVGCLPQRYGRKLLGSMPEVDLFAGISYVRQLPRLLNGHPGDGARQLFLEAPRYLMNFQTPRVLSPPYHSAYLKIAEGCSNRCSFCVIPAIRGPYRSRPLDDLMQEASWLASQGVKELILVAQDTTAYGIDRAGGPRLPELLETLAKSGWFSWIRLLYGHPQKIQRRLIEVIREHPCLCCYLDLPFQHASARLLKAMRRAGTGRQFLELIAFLRETLPDLSLRSTVIVGFPGECESDFQELYDFVGQARFEHLGIFVYSAEKGTAAARLGSPVPEAIKQERLKAIAALQAEISLGHHRRLLGTVQQVLLEACSEESGLPLRGRLASQAPEVDGCVLIRNGSAQVGEILPVRILEAHPYDLVGEIVDSEIF